VEQAYWERDQRQANLPKPSEGGCKRGSYRMLLPPPNVTGNLHLGHALMATVQDVIARQRQHLGYEVDWVPGTDHAGIATQVVVERTLAASTLSDEKVLEGLQWLFRKFLTFEIPPPKRFHRSKWFSNPNFRGTWTFRPTKADERETGPRDLEAPVMGEDGHLGLLFAGEASSRNHFSTVHGAVEAGWREADRLIRLYSTCGSKS